MQGRTQDFRSSPGGEGGWGNWKNIHFSSGPALSVTVPTEDFIESLNFSGGATVFLDQPPPPPPPLFTAL